MNEYLHALDEEGEVVVENLVELRHRRRAASYNKMGKGRLVILRPKQPVKIPLQSTPSPRKGMKLKGLALETAPAKRPTDRPTDRPTTHYYHAHDVKRAQSVINFLPFLLLRPRKKNRPLFCRRNDGFPTNE